MSAKILEQLMNNSAVRNSEELEKLVLDSASDAYADWGPGPTE